MDKNLFPQNLNEMLLTHVVSKMGIVSQTTWYLSILWADLFNDMKNFTNVQRERKLHLDGFYN
jgi:hypothetical protein